MQTDARGADFTVVKTRWTTCEHDDCGMIAEILGELVLDTGEVMSHHFITRCALGHIDAPTTTAEANPDNLRGS